MAKLIKTSMMKRYMIKLVMRVVIFLSVLAVYITNKEWLYNLVTQPMWMKITPLHILWAIFMITMLLHIFPIKNLSMALKKAQKEQYVEVPEYDELELYRFVKDQNIKAWQVMLVWLLFNCIWGALYLFKVIDSADLLMLTVFYFLCDYICILFYCPFQSVIMKNKCCVNCRIYDWGHFMMFTPMLFIRNFFSWSLFFTSCVVLIHWEMRYAKYPERFWSGSNETLKCSNCQDKTCQIKNKIKREYKRRRIKKHKEILERCKDSYSSR
ncbi:MAG: hypothetical protein J6F30_17765 [Cellulosilyticum sp.]|nr:hypothetical protein [Cellulosilyticum sp.]